MQMMKNTFPAPKTTRKLNTNLKEFGLNPREWIIRPMGQQDFRIFHKDDRSLSLRGQGRITTEGIQWTALAWELPA